MDGADQWLAQPLKVSSLIVAVKALFPYPAKPQLK